MKTNVKKTMITAMMRSTTLAKYLQIAYCTPTNDEQMMRLVKDARASVAGVPAPNSSTRGIILSQEIHRIRAVINPISIRTKAIIRVHQVLKH